jgi:hypothetical protein
MGILIQADEGDRIYVGACPLSAEEPDFLVFLCLTNLLDPTAIDWERVTLLPEQARKLGRALIAAADGVTCPDEVLEIDLM